MNAHFMSFNLKQFIHHWAFNRDDDDDGHTQLSGKMSGKIDFTSFSIEGWEGNSFWKINKYCEIK